MVESKTKKTKRTLVKNDVIAFLKGSAPLEGVWFGQIHPTEPAYWWRKYLLNVEVKNAKR